MSTTLTWLGHGGWSIRTGDHVVLLDPFLTDCPNATMTVDEVEADFVLLSHGHFDHVADVPAIAKRTDAQVITNFEIAQWLAEQHDVKKTLGMNIGGAVSLPFGQVKMTQAIHSSQLPDRSYGGEAAGFLITIGEQRLYFACDTALFSDMQQIGSTGLDLAVLPIGDLFTMGPEDSLQAIQWLAPKKVAPAHYNTWPPIQQDAAKWAASVHEQTDAQPVVLQPGDTLEL